MMQTSRHFAKGVQRVALADVLSRSIHTKVDLLKMIGLAFEQPLQVHAQGSRSDHKASNPTEFLSALEKVGFLQYKQLLSHYAGQGDAKSAISVFNRLKELEVPDNHTYHTLLVACVNGGDQASAFNFLQQMKKEGITPRLESENYVLSGYTEGGNVEDAIKIFDQMKNANVRTYNLLMAVCFNGKQPEKAMTYWKEMEKAGLTPDLESYNTLLSRGAPSFEIIDLSGILGVGLAPSKYFS